MGVTSVRFVTAPLGGAAVAGSPDPWGSEREIARETRALAPETRQLASEAPKVHRRFDPELARRDALARIAGSVAARQAAIGSQAGPGRSVRLRQILELDALRAAERAVREFDGAALGIVAKVEAANLIQEIALLDPASPTFREELFRLRQRLYGISAGCLADERLLGTACMAIRVLEDAVRRLLSGRGAADQIASTVLDEHAVLIEEQRIHAIWSLLNALGNVRVVGLDRDETDAVVQLLRRVDPQAFGFDPRNQRFVRHVADLIGKVSGLAA